MTHGGRVSPHLPSRAARLITQIDSGEALGASRQLGLIGDALLTLVEDYADHPLRLQTAVRILAEHLVQTRGASSQAITNGLHLMVGSILSETADASETRHHVEVGPGACERSLICGCGISKFMVPHCCAERKRYSPTTIPVQWPAWCVQWLVLDNP